MLSLWKWLCNRNKIAVTHIDNHTNTKGTTQPAIQLSQSKDDTNETCPTEVHIPTDYPHWIDVLLHKKKNRHECCVFKCIDTCETHRTCSLQCSASFVHSPNYCLWRKQHRYQRRYHLRSGSLHLSVLHVQ